MKKILLGVSIILLCLAAVIPVAFAEQIMADDKQAIKDERQEIKEHASAARQEEKRLRDQIHAATQAGDMETAGRLREQLRAMHQENVREMQQDKWELKEARRELKEDMKQARRKGDLPPRRDRDGNPPGPVGGPGTNWENPPGPQGGPGASPDRRHHHAGIDRDNNPPGPRGGRGTNWENPPGPKGGRGASPNRRPRR